MQCTHSPEHLFLGDAAVKHPILLESRIVLDLLSHLLILALNENDTRATLKFRIVLSIGKLLFLFYLFIIGSDIAF